ncbi:MAG: thiamine pyrophosphate-dependent dehydrogenase E1 component subunit alpha [Opitutae bacterium]|nr:thiamine pyrophosphate-dependent dehydrogenase E1 component subunit alpha [Opitutae bacterium]
MLAAATLPPTVATALSVRLLESMVRIRFVEEAIARHYAGQQMRCPVHLSIGQEAAAAGVCAALRADDLAMSGHRSHAHYLAKGGDLPAMIAELYGKATGCCQGRGGSMHLVDLAAGFVGAVPIVGSTIPIATGLAFADRQLKRDRVTVAFLGEAATEEGVFHESANFASLHALPLVFVCENNLYSVYSPMHVRQPAHREVWQLAAGHGIAAHQGDGNDPLAVHELMHAAVAHARAGRGPVFLELKTYRWREHCGPGFDNHIGYRTEAEYLAWRERDPIARFEHRLQQSGEFDELRHAQFKDAVEAEIAAAFAAAQLAPFPAGTSLLHHVYAES